ncbi:DUF4041 domain-containing protein [Lactococcus lactis]|uniref:DUF4041 domain-containing protein n=1 Tax=Lactococcus lactis TaxID=1358 RepID=UPI001913F3BD|nr:DUF4041 domain-containing protein [Lactococcus lactis]WDA67432.1 DUF4041 domain-containing protein [Lactococcus lactis]WDA67497.1 DUF4041 domain-containing protein [Lactococcus lactis]
MGIFNIRKPKDEQLNAKIEELNHKIKDKEQELERIKKEISMANDELTMQEFGFFKRRYKFSESTKYKEALNDIRAKEKLLVKTGQAGIILQPMQLDNSTSKGRALQKSLIKAAIRGFNGESDALLTKISVSNAPQKISALIKAFEQLNKMYFRNQISIAPEYLRLKKQELQIAAEFELKKQEEKDILREQREREKEEKKFQEELKKQQIKYDKDIAQFTNAIEIAESKLLTASKFEIEELTKQILEYKQKIKNLNCQGPSKNVGFGSLKM